MCIRDRRVASEIFIPLTVGGGIRTLDDFDRVLKCGADKVSVNSGAIADPSIIAAAAKKYGDQCVVLSMDVKRVDGQFLSLIHISHMGWNSLRILKDDPLFRYVRDGEYVYYVHSFYARDCAGSTLATSRYGNVDVTGVVRRGNVYGTQFHPEKSGDTGLRLLRAFAEL